VDSIVLLDLFISASPVIGLLDELVASIGAQLLLLVMHLEVLAQPVLEHLLAAQAALALAPAPQVVREDERALLLRRSRRQVLVFLSEAAPAQRTHGGGVSGSLSAAAARGYGGTAAGQFCFVGLDAALRLSYIGNTGALKVRRHYRHLQVPRDIL
jgi:hypothetical protein